MAVRDGREEDLLLLGHVRVHLGFDVREVVGQPMRAMRLVGVNALDLARRGHEGGQVTPMRLVIFGLDVIDELSQGLRRPMHGLFAALSRFEVGQLRKHRGGIDPGASAGVDQLPAASAAEVQPVAQEYGGGLRVCGGQVSESLVGVDHGRLHRWRGSAPVGCAALDCR